LNIINNSTNKLNDTLLFFFAVHHLSADAANAFDASDYEETRRIAKEILAKDKNSKDGLLWNAKACDELRLYPEALDMCTKLAAYGHTDPANQIMHGKVEFSACFWFFY